MAAVESLHTEVETYERERKSLLAGGHEGKFVLIHGNNVAGTWGTFEDALRDGYKQFGLEPFLVKQVQNAEPIQFITRDVSLCQH